MADAKFKKIKFAGNKFIKVKCKDCGNEQITYSKVSSKVVCSICGSTLAVPTGGDPQRLPQMLLRR
ncbi:30S ribosomal protein S27e [Thermogymnomonas acidicola]|uniref:30S ribosomal protein S27e n=1 Tax=Thermogymnomonas acidicola TaxID=399579 RepID=UPI00094632D1|nr:30S ribosomal protein S27e [Thermogymnomonas acidicola]